MFFFDSHIKFKYFSQPQNWDESRLSYEYLQNDELNYYIYQSESYRLMQMVQNAWKSSLNVRNKDELSEHAIYKESSPRRAKEKTSGDRKLHLITPVLII